MSLAKIMWYHEQNKVIFPSERISSALTPQAMCKDHMELPPSTDGEFLVGPSKKRKTVDMNQGGSDTSGHLVLDSWSRESKSPQKTSTFPEMDLRPCSSQAPNHSEPNIMVPQLGKYQFQSLNNFSVSSQINDGDIPKAPAEQMNHSSLQLHSLYAQEPLPLMKFPATAISTSPDRLTLPFNNMSYQIGAQRFFSYSDPSIKCLEKDSPGFCDGLNIGLKYSTLTHDSSLSKAPECLGSLGTSELKRQLTLHVNSGGITHVLDACDTVSSLEANQTFDGASSKDISSVGAGPLGSSSCTDGKSIVEPYQHSNIEVRTSTSLENVVASNLKGGDQNHGDHDIQIMKETEKSSLESIKHSLGKEASKDDDIPLEILVGQGHGDCSRDGSHDLDGKSTSCAGKIASTIVEKLWDGSLQLSGSVTVPAVAFFKSGEKVPEINWSKSIEVKGKVRLEAFEKYIQELPRSRSRALMVISLCWKVGSSETGFKGMKEVAKGYKERRKVGFAELSPGLDIYVCPRSETIITILAKYGFFKGMAAVEDDQDSMIGCVVWRRKQASPETASKMSEKKNPSSSEQPLNPTSETDIQQTYIGNTALSQTHAGSSPLCSDTVAAAPEISGSLGIGNKTISCSTVQLEAGKSFTNVNSNPVPSVSTNSSASPVGCQTAVCSDSSLKVVYPLMCGPGSEKHDDGLELPTAVFPVPSEVVKPHNRSDLYDEDLPEFDFSAACGVSHGSVKKSHSSGNRVDVSNAFPLGMNVGASIPSVMPIMQPMEFCYQQQSEFPISGGFQFDKDQENPILKHQEDDPSRPVLPLPEKTDFYSSKWSSQSVTAIPTAKHRWDDDDMPEWCPPKLENQNHPPAAAAVSSWHSVPYGASTVQSPMLEQVRFIPPLPMSIHPSLRPSGLPPPLPMSTHPSLRSEGLPPPLPMSIHPSLRSEGLPPPPPMSLHPSLRPEGLPRPPPMSPHPSLRPEGLSPRPPLLPHPSQRAEGLIPPPPPMSIHPSLQPEGLHPPPPMPMQPSPQPDGLPLEYQHYPVTAQTQHVDGGYTQYGSTSSMRFHWDPAFRPASKTFDVRPINGPTGWRGWRS